MELHPFRAVRPTRAEAARVASPPYDVVNSQEARAMAAGNEASFLHVIKPEIDLPEGTGPYEDSVYEEAASQLQRLLQDGIMAQDEAPALWAYRQIMDGRAQVGIVGCSNVEGYALERIKRHEYTRPDKENDRTRHVDTTNANAGPVFLACRGTSDLQSLIDDWTSGTPEFDFVGWNGVQHTLWRITDASQLDRAATVYQGIDSFYIADGHHRAASAWRVRELRKKRNNDTDGTEPWNRFLTVVFPEEQLRILAYNRVVHDLHDLSPEAFLEQVSERFEVGPVGANPIPSMRHSFSMFLGGNWYSLTARPEIVDETDSVACLDVAILQDHLLGPVLGVQDPRTNKRIQFVGGIRGTDELERLVAEGNYHGVAFSMYPTALAELFAVADAGRVMPPKSTWFEPKLASGLLVYPLS